MVAELINQGQIVGWFQGGSEYGPRALGNRSILADSRRAEMENIINHRIKHRESFRPFAPAILAERCREYFEIDSVSPFMLLVAAVKKPDVIPSVTHIDGTARVQTVTREENGIFYDLINEFSDITNVPVILNTSFNDAGEPIVETPEDAMICFLRTGMDSLVLGDYLVHSNEVDNERIAKLLTTDRDEKLERRTEELISRFFPGHDEEECHRFIVESNKISSWHAQYRSKYELEKRVLDWKKAKTRILIIGTKDHTALLPAYINGFFDVNVIGFVNYNGRPDRDSKVDCPYQEIDWDKAEAIGFDEILISSYEFAFDIAEDMQGREGTKSVYEIYDDMSRSFHETFVNFPRFNFTLKS